MGGKLNDGTSSSKKRDPIFDVLRYLETDSPRMKDESSNNFAVSPQL